jgi:hypothetical protein
VSSFDLSALLVSAMQACAPCGAMDGQSMDPVALALGAGIGLSVSTLWASDLYRRGQMESERAAADPAPPEDSPAYGEWENRQKWDRWLREQNPARAVWVDYGPTRSVYYGLTGEVIGELPRGPYWDFEATGADDSGSP